MRKNESSYFEEPEFKALLNKYEGMVKSHTPCYFDTHELLEIGCYYVNSKRMDDAYKAVKFCNEMHPNDPDTIVTIASILLDTGHIDEARQIAAKIENPNSLEVMVLIGNFLILDHKDAELRQLLLKISEAVGDDDIWTHTEIFRQATKVKDRSLAAYWFHFLETHFDLDKEADKDDFLCQELFAYLSTAQDYEQTARFLTIYLDNHPYDVEHWTHLCQAHYYSGKKEEALSAIDFAMAIDENNPTVLHMKAMLEEEFGHIEEALSLYGKLAEIAEKAEKDEERKEYLVKMMQLKLAQMDQKDGLSGLFFAAEHPQGSLDMHGLILLASEALEKGNQAKARFYYERAKQADFEDPTDLYHLGVLALDLKEATQALQYFEGMLGLTLKHPEHDSYCCKIGDSLAAHGQYADAVTYYAHFIDNNPHQVHKVSGAILLALMKTDKLKELYEWNESLLFMDPEVYSQFTAEQTEQLKEALEIAKDFLGPDYFKNRKLDF